MSKKLQKTVPLTQRDIARKSGLSDSAISLIFRGLRRADPDSAKKLEEATGIDRRAWCWPDEWDNPLLK